MAAVVDPEGPQLCVLPSNPAPEGMRAGWFMTSDGVKLRFASFPRTGPVHRGTVCLVQGRTEFIEKYFETIADFQSRGFAVATFDWRGQGGSQRLIGPKKLGYVERFEDYWIDLQSFHREILLPDCPPPFYLVGHSMGGLVSLLAGTKDRMMFDRMLVSAPMVALDRQPLSMGGMAAVCDTLCFFGLGQAPVGRRQDKSPTEASFPNNAVTSDKPRFMRTVDTFRARPDLEIASPTVRWSAAAFRAMAEAGTDRFPGSLKIPTLMLAAARDTVVSSSAIEQLGLRMRNGKHAMIAGAKHELFMENDFVRAQVFAAFDAFMGQPNH
jgi:lysophospholipase